MLSDEKISELWYANAPLGNFAFKFARAIEAAVLAEQAKQEPAAWCICIENEPCQVFLHKQLAELEFSRRNELWPDPSRKLMALYLHPAPIPEGMVLVPREPTMEMCQVSSEPMAAKHLYRAMIAAVENETRK